ncbi:hypothetical protein GBAR_LOCUS12335 [Geodia barretti]|uniref:Uncharacterized protein n=1 Tax=Geodia barretti TaxID=519541 RepID=A0AA35S107_GEOBA|nr:hypothetical protein GBAR_LOCUS12335 [Geodia barretti]
MLCLESALPQHGPTQLIVLTPGATCSSSWVLLHLLSEEHGLSIKRYMK